jgi:aldehyde dehydrogenase (NAD+)
VEKLSKPAIRHLDRIFVDGAWIKPHCAGQISIVSPDTEQVICSVAEADTADVDQAVAAARDAFDRGVWSRRPPAERADMLARLAGALRSRHPELEAAWTLQIGGLSKLAYTQTTYGTANIDNAIEVGRAFAFERGIETASAGMGILVHEPVGVVAAVAPWNGPYPLMTAKIAPALMAGCSVIMKPAPETPLEAYIIAECAEAVGFPAGVVNLLTADREVSDHLVSHLHVDKVSFTGSTAVGKRIATVCGERVARCTLELGGKSAAIILDDYDDDDAADLLTRTITLLSGQVCSMISRAIVPRHRQAALADAIRRRMESVRVGHATDPESDMGPLASKRQLERVEQFISKGVDDGAKLLTGGSRPADLDCGHFIRPTLFADVDNRSTIAQEEIFGPVLCLIPYDGVEDAIRIANESPYGLHGTVLTHDHVAAYSVARAVRAGTYAQNGMKVDFAWPFGGMKQSGTGREGGEEGLLAYLETKVMLLDRAV